MNVEVNSPVSERLNYDAILNERLTEQLLNIVAEDEDGVEILVEYVWHMVHDPTAEPQTLVSELKEFLGEKTESFVLWLTEEVFPHIPQRQNAAPHPKATSRDMCGDSRKESRRSVSYDVSHEGMKDEAALDDSRWRGLSRTEDGGRIESPRGRRGGDQRNRIFGLAVKQVSASRAESRRQDKGVESGRTEKGRIRLARRGGRSSAREGRVGHDRRVYLHGNKSFDVDEFYRHRPREESGRYGQDGYGRSRSRDGQSVPRRAYRQRDDADWYEAYDNRNGRYDERYERRGERRVHGRRGLTEAREEVHGKVDEDQDRRSKAILRPNPQFENGSGETLLTSEAPQPVSMTPSTYPPHPPHPPHQNINMNYHSAATGVRPPVASPLMCPPSQMQFGGLDSGPSPYYQMGGFRPPMPPTSLRHPGDSGISKFGAAAPGRPGGVFKVKKKCINFPNCQFGDNCRFIHPAELCSMWPKCPFGVECFYIHPEVQCKYGQNCLNWFCNYTHPASWSPPMFSGGFGHIEKRNRPPASFRNKTLNLALESAASEEMIVNADDEHCVPELLAADASYSGDPIITE